MIPGSVAPLERICVSENNVLLLYGNSRTRLWDTNTQEFWRSMGQDQVVELLNQGGWFDACVDFCPQFDPGIDFNVLVLWSNSDPLSCARRWDIWKIMLM